VSGSSPLEITWTKDGFGLIEETTPNFKTHFNKQTGLCSLSVIKCDMNESGLYSCKAKNAAGMAETSAYLKIKEESKKTNHSPPYVITPIESAEICANSNHLLECVITGDPEPRISWYKDGVAIENLEPSVTSTLKANSFINIRQLAISNAQPDKHAGKYTCKAENDYGIADCSTFLLIRGKTYLLDFIAIKLFVIRDVLKAPSTFSITTELMQAPVIVEHLQNIIMVKEGLPIKFFCRFNAYPRADVVWLRDNKQIDLNLMGMSKDFTVTNLFQRD
jgi:hypothetical protein